MKTGLLIAGSICLGVAVVLAVLTLVLPAGSVMFMIGEGDQPWFPIIALGVVGIVLLAFSGVGRRLRRSP
jgi:hypothetical protein